MSHFRLVTRKNAFTYDFNLKTNLNFITRSASTSDKAGCVNRRICVINAPGSFMFKVPVSCFRMPGSEKLSNPSSRPPIPPTPDVVFAAGTPHKTVTASLVRRVTVCDGFRLGLFMLEVSGYDEFPSREQFHFDRTSKELVLMVLLKNVKKTLNLKNGWVGSCQITKNGINLELIKVF